MAFIKIFVLGCLIPLGFSNVTHVTEQRLLIDKLRWSYLEIEARLWNDPENIDAEVIGIDNLISNFIEFDEQMSQMPTDLLYGLEPFERFSNFLFIYAESRNIHKTYQRFRELLLDPETDWKGAEFPEEYIVRDITNKGTGVNRSMDLIRQMTILQSGNILQKIEEVIAANSLCYKLDQSPELLLYNLYNFIALNDLKAYVLQQFVQFMGYIRSSEESYSTDSAYLRINYDKITTKIVNDFRSALTKASASLWRCEPSHFIEGKNYDQFPPYETAIIQNEGDISRKKTCTNTCEDYKKPVKGLQRCEQWGTLYCKKFRACPGNIKKCRSANAYKSVCYSDSPNRFYDSINLKNGPTKCANPAVIEKWLRGFVYCDYCICTCETNNDIYINLRRRISDEKSNSVITGARLVKHNNILHIQYQEGQLLPYGFINQSTVKWVNVENLRSTDANVVRLRPSNEYYMYLHEEVVNYDNSIVTGVYFHQRDLADYKPVQLMVNFSPFNWSTGEVFYGQRYDKFVNTDLLKSFSEYKPSGDIPIKTSAQSETHYTNKLIPLQTSSFEGDFSQSTIPFIDTQEVANKPAAPLNGIGFYYKYSTGYGGFFTLRVKTINYGRHMVEEIAEMGDTRFIDLEEETETTPSEEYEQGTKATAPS